VNPVLAVSGDGAKLRTLKPDADPGNGKIDPPIDLGGSPEFLAADDAGKAYINLEDKDVVAVVDLRMRKVVARWPVAPCGHPVGMAIDEKRHLLFIGCRSPQKLIVMSTDDGKVIADLPIGAGNDAIATDGKWQIEQVVKTPNGARTIRRGYSSSFASSGSWRSSGAGNAAGSIVARPIPLAASRSCADAETKTISVPGNMSRAATTEPSCSVSGQRSVVRSSSCRAASSTAGFNGCCTSRADSVRSISKAAAAASGAMLPDRSRRRIAAQISSGVAAEINLRLSSTD